MTFFTQTICLFKIWTFWFSEECSLSLRCRWTAESTPQRSGWVLVIWAFYADLTKTHLSYPHVWRVFLMFLRFNLFFWDMVGLMTFKWQKVYEKLLKWKLKHLQLQNISAVGFICCLFLVLSSPGLLIFWSWAFKNSCELVSFSLVLCTFLFLRVHNM